MRCFLAFLLLAINTSLVAAQSPDNGSISGRIVADEDGGPLARAEVSLLGSHDLTVFTDDEGRYAFKELPPGSYKLTASHIGFVSASSAAPYMLDSGESR